MSKTINYDPVTKTKEVMHFDKMGEHIIESIQDCDDVLAFNAHLEGQLDKKSDWWLVGSIPLGVCQQWAIESGTKAFSKEWQEYAKRQMNDPDYQKLNPNRIKV